ncbi:hypothetical protein [Hyalangium rubrum]|uniref:LytR/CpsA/Psr regulator C-terminal domain-containing protein n=1 Tax=Hyalangium rubrum TaxID=3103134 RepID=A0ABU5H2C1_9BACT|nr:hypothetical protein [Hyalangium sp. s54d21]MDY7227603.1 hypothetical protein [Hyalangium sp. s54d21]
MRRKDALLFTGMMLLTQQASGAEGFRAILASEAAPGHTRYETVQVDTSGKVQRRAGIVLLVDGKPQELQVSTVSGPQKCGKTSEGFIQNRFHLVPVGGGAGRELLPPKKDCHEESRMRTGPITAIAGPYLSLDAGGQVRIPVPETIDLRTGKSVPMASLNPQFPTLARQAFDALERDCIRFDPKLRYGLHWNDSYQLAVYIYWRRPEEYCEDGKEEAPNGELLLTQGPLRAYGAEPATLKGKAGEIFIAEDRSLMAELGGKAIELASDANLVGWEADANLPPEAFAPAASLAAEERLVEGILAEVPLAPSRSEELLRDAEKQLKRLESLGSTQVASLRARLDAAAHPLRGATVELLDAGAGSERLDALQQKLEAEGARVVKRGPAQSPRKFDAYYLVLPDTLLGRAFAKLADVRSSELRSLDWQSPGQIVVVLGGKP